MGCSKNLVDSEVLAGQLKKMGISVAHNDENNNSDTIIVNTCGFINDAKEESIDTILQLAKDKKNGLINHLFVFGCLSERYKDELKKEIHEVDEFFGVNSLTDIVQNITKDFEKELIGERLIATPPHYAYLKIAEGCDRKCSFCSIPSIRGKYISRTSGSLLTEAQHLSAQGVKEMMVIAQDLTYYGTDLYKKPQLTSLIDRLSNESGMEWIRLHYAYPAKFPKDLIKLMKERENICNYIDIPFQHISDKMLKIMRRNHTKSDILNLIDYFRKEIPDMAIRTTLLVGHPGETKKDFDELLRFVEDAQIDRLGVFTYSHEEDSWCWNKYKDNIPAKTKRERMETVMEVQQSISAKLNSGKSGKTFKTIIDRKEGDLFIGRTQYDSPEVDNEIIIKSKKNLKPGSFYNILITDSSEFDLFGKF
ncbi:MAG: ribosomal protein S12 methylthiotransferase RimO [Bacteroidetes bacterium GWF2_38_335]|nr:MAG: ribosomal protein S12 methylthiotransferase RimO [Bacteroidetes bacterium GWF2_38_335]OFY81923.1 MAG: ribosomal protein S12 methylthiotransferase RimO [Bacteroidetes bacterium RIFOXYA12_FULL_38_20]HBS87915.1 30S ribosomal protein S12 methylthiotransferase RimO [Bacteroidales bacterium]